MKKIAPIFLSLAFLLISIEDSMAAPKLISIGTGAPMGVYYPAGGSICRLINRGRNGDKNGNNGHGIRCSVDPTDGSDSNLKNIISGENDFGIVQSDWKYHAYNVGIAGNKKGRPIKPFKDLRTVFNLYTETFSIAVTQKSNIRTLNDILGKKVNFGPTTSGMYATMEILLAVKGWKKEYFAEIKYLKPSEQIGYLCRGRIDAMVYISGNPNGVLQEASQTCKIRILNIDRKTIQDLISANPYYVEAVIPGGMYAGNPNDITTFGMQASVVTTEAANSDAVYNMVKAVFENFDNFKTLHPVFSSLRKEDMVKSNINSAPMHLSSLRYFGEAKLIQKKADNDSVTKSDGAVGKEIKLESTKQ